ncbi:hypothetical protein SAMN05216199_3771 [Pedococcus cremeus]|uniref:DUF4386 family protein n=1 Tax=Pedococcus cremeus TaxID=587636 RepID=A0A1H9XGX4_9MICO|nr:hypothetical protein [Pedococcus cremeus]SES45281.1 hypothetical protein SAMN05216199_3771 [Pedococcus cremeus]
MTANANTLGVTTRTTSDSPTTTASPAAEDARRASSRALPVVAATALIAGPLLWSLGMFTSPPADSMADADYISSLARDTTMTQVSALALHYGNLTIALGVLAAPALVRRARGAWLAVVGAVLTTIGFANVSGMVLSDWWNASAGRALPMDQAVEVFRGFKDASLLWMWDGTEPLSLVGPLLLLAGLARAGVLGWWTIAPFLGGVAGLMAFGAGSPVLVAVMVLVGFSPFALIGVRLLQRSRLHA